MVFRIKYLWGGLGVRMLIFSILVVGIKNFFLFLISILNVKMILFICIVVRVCGCVLESVNIFFLVFDSVLLFKGNFF